MDLSSCSKIKYYLLYRVGVLFSLYRLNFGEKEIGDTEKKTSWFQLVINLSKGLPTQMGVTHVKRQQVCLSTFVAKS